MENQASEIETFKSPEEVYPKMAKLAPGFNNRQICHCYNSRNMATLKDMLGWPVWKELVLSPIGILAKLVDAPVVWTGGPVHYLLCNRLHVKKKEIWSVVGDEPIRFSLLEYGAITGLNIDPIPTESCKEHACQKEFWKKLNLSPTEGPMPDELYKLVDDSKAWPAKERLWLGLLYLLAVALLGCPHRSRMPLEIASRVLYVDDADYPEVFNNYPWGRVGLEALLGSIQFAHVEDSEGKPKASYWLNGNPFVLMAWAFESVTCFREQFTVGAGVKYYLEYIIESNEEEKQMWEEESQKPLPPLLKYKTKRPRGGVLERKLESEIEKEGRVRVLNMMVRKDSVEEMFPYWPQGEEDADPGLDKLITDLYSETFVRGEYWRNTGNTKTKKTKTVSVPDGPQQKRRKKDKKLEGCEIAMVVSKGEVETVVLDRLDQLTVAVNQLVGYAAQGGELFPSADTVTQKLLHSNSRGSNQLGKQSGNRQGGSETPKTPLNPVVSESKEKSGSSPTPLNNLPGDKQHTPHSENQSKPIEKPIEKPENQIDGPKVSKELFANGNTIEQKTTPTPDWYATSPAKPTPKNTPAAKTKPTPKNTSAAKTKPTPRKTPAAKTKPTPKNTSAAKTKPTQGQSPAAKTKPPEGEPPATTKPTQGQSPAEPRLREPKARILTRASRKLMSQSNLNKALGDADQNAFRPPDGAAPETDQSVENDVTLATTVSKFKRVRGKKSEKSTAGTRQAGTLKEQEKEEVAIKKEVKGNKKSTTKRASKKQNKSAPDSDLKDITEEVEGEYEVSSPGLVSPEDARRRYAVIKGNKEKGDGQTTCMGGGVVASPSTYDPLSPVDPEKEKKLMELVAELGSAESGFWTTLITKRPWINQEFGWLSDDHISVYLRLLTQRSRVVPSPFSDRIAFLDQWVMSEMVKQFTQFKVKAKSFTFNYHNSPYVKLIQGGTPVDLPTGKKWFVDVDHLYGVLNTNGEHWVAYHVDLTEEGMITAYDPIIGAQTEQSTNRMKGFFVPLLRMIPGMVKELLPDKKHVWTLSNGELKFRWMEKEKIPQNLQVGDCGVYALKFVECLALGASFSGICDESIQRIRVKMAAKILDERANNLEKLFP